jgi:hypothetical protein
MARYELWLTDDTGLRITDRRGRSYLKSFLNLTASRAVNAIGRFTLEVPAGFDDNLLKPDRMIQVWRAPTGGRLGLWRVYFLRRWIFETRGGEESVILSGPDTNDLLRRRIVAAYAASAQADKTDLADDMMKEIVTEAIADGVAPTPDAGSRVWSDLSIAGDLGDGPTITKGFSFDPLLTASGQGVLPALAKAARVAGTEVFFDIVPNVVSGSSITFQFRTYTGQPGQDVTGQGVLFDQQRGNMRNPRLEYDYTEEENYIYAAGQGVTDTRNVQQVYDSARDLASQWNRCEGHADARNQTADNGVREAGRAALEDGRPRIRFQAEPVDTTGTRFGRDWDFGYKVRSRYRNVEFDTIIRAVTISVDGNGTEDVRARLEHES